MIATALKVNDPVIKVLAATLRASAMLFTLRSCSIDVPPFCISLEMIATALKVNDPGTKVLAATLFAHAEVVHVEPSARARNSVLL